ncbi:MAG: hypothetical protein CO108_27695 [Deltaproteobacteria bacterium CG_4_9_14_3_um_filter_63_12]|nr:MAG: hypothetical protein COW42_11740 [Deltaproteobacteria bacterium CG17_big_fil_post_rev_8_21_14_2_50_63_7]PJB34691.1 MAG: hypothetical protein CO108_27695 [Deltaproteobacteria bacterium CG_4_9_14_3_um_filter_63_12]
MPELSLNGGRVWYRLGSEPLLPDRPTLVFVHGAGASSLTWLYQLRALRQSMNCVSIDLPGHGKSDECAKCASIADYAERLAEILALLGLEDVVLVGHSMGAAVAMECLAKGGSYSAGILVGAGPTIPVSRMITEALETNIETWSEMMEDLLFSPATPRRFVSKSHAASSLQAPREVIRDDFVACGAWSIADRLANIKVPCLVIGGRDDALTPSPIIEALGRTLPNAKFEIIDDAGHMVMVERHKRVNELIIEFVHRQEAHKPRVRSRG